MQQFPSVIARYLGKLHMPILRWTDIVEILIIAFLVYNIIIWIRNARAWALLKGLAVILIFVIIAALFNMTTILWMVQNVAGIAIIALVIILQPELRNAMEELGQKNILSSIFRFDINSADGGRFTDKTVGEIVRASVSMGKVRTGALIVIEQTTPLNEYERTGIEIDAVVTSQLLINIFEKNTPLHDGAVIIRGDRVVSATCYLPLSDNKLDKNFGTRHRAGVGISEVSDSMTIIVSEETGHISIAYKGALEENVDAATLKERLTLLQGKQNQDDRHGFIPWKGRG